MLHVSRTGGLQPPSQKNATKDRRFLIPDTATIRWDRIVHFWRTDRSEVFDAFGLTPNNVMSMKSLQRILFPSVCARLPQTRPEPAEMTRRQSSTSLFALRERLADAKDHALPLVRSSSGRNRELLCAAIHFAQL
jgi:hypothetical protein